MNQYYRKGDIDGIVQEMERVLEKTRTRFDERYGSNIKQSEANVLWAYEQAITHIKTLLSRIDSKHHISVINNK